MKMLVWLTVLVFCWMYDADDARACSCDRGTPAAGYDRAQYVFTGKVLDADHHEWLIGIERVWKGRDKLGLTVKLKDAYASTDCEFFFQEGQRYLFFAIVAKGGKHVFYHPQVCNWTSPLQSMRVPDQAEPLWIEDYIVRVHGPGELPRETP
jgi:hypothetical protein